MHTQFSRCALRALSPLLVASFVAIAAPAVADTPYPSKSITLVVPYAPGGMGDVFARVIAERLGAAWKQTVVVDNKPGAGGAIGAKLVAHAAPDGYTLLLGQTGEIAINQVAMKQAGYDALRDLKPVILIGDSPLVMITAPSSPYKSIGDLRAAMIAKPGELSYASSGTGTPGHLAGAAFGFAAKAPAIHVPYKGGGPAMTDVLGGHVAFFFASAVAARPQIQGGLVRPLAVSSLTRMPSLPDVPTVAESGAPGFSFSIWGGVFAPSKTPDSLVLQINREINRIMTEPGVVQQLEQQGAILKANTPAEFGQFVQREVAKYDQIVKQTGITLD